MKLTVDAKALSSAASIAGRVIEDRTPWPVLSNIHLTADGETLTLRGANADVAYEATIPANVSEPGVALISFSTLAKFISAAKGDEIAIETDAEKAVIKCGRGRIALALGIAGEYPIRAMQSDALVSVDPATFIKALRFCAAAVQPSEVKYHIAGVNFSEDENGVDLWGTDAKIAHHAHLPHLPSIGGGGQVPIEATGIILGVADRAKELWVSVSATEWVIKSDGVKAWGKVIDAKYPDLKRALASQGEWSEIALADPAEVVRAIDIAICGADANSDKTRHVAMRCDDGMVLRGFRPGSGVISAGRAEVDAEARGKFSAAVSADYLRASLNGIGTDGAIIEAAKEAIRITPRQSDDTIQMEGVIFILRATEAELADA